MSLIEEIGFLYVGESKSNTERIKWIKKEKEEIINHEERKREKKSFQPDNEQEKRVKKEGNKEN